MIVNCVATKNTAQCGLHGNRLVMCLNLHISTACVYRECESSELKGSASASLMKAITQSNSQSTTGTSNSKHNRSLVSPHQQFELGGDPRGSGYMPSSSSHYKPLTQQQQQQQQLGPGSRQSFQSVPVSSLQHTSNMNVAMMSSGL